MVKEMEHQVVMAGLAAPEALCHRPLLYNRVNTAPVVHNGPIQKEPRATIAALQHRQVAPAEEDVFFDSVLVRCEAVVADEVGFMRRSVRLYLDQLVADEVVSRDEGAL